MKNLLAISLCILLITSPVLAQGNQFEVRYVGGSISSTVKPDDWKNSLTITSEAITLKLKDGQEVKIEPKNVKLITHGHQASRRIGTYAALAIISPIFLFGMLKKNKRNFVGIAYETDGNKQGINLQVKNDKYLAMLTALEGVTGLKTEEEVEDKNKKDKDKSTKTP
jgi:opacity protein-like surface antigen